jgi:hypothetical protein
MIYKYAKEAKILQYVWEMKPGLCFVYLVSHHVKYHVYILSRKKNHVY